MFKKVAKILISIAVCLILWGWLITSIRCNRLEGFGNISFVANLRRINSALVNYANAHSGKMPNSRDWADAIIGNQNLVLKEDFGSPSCLFGVFYNERLSGRDYSALKDNCVVLFEGKGQWNATGSKDTFYSFASKRKQSHLVTLKGDAYEYYSSSNVMVRLKDGVHVESNSLIWE